MNNLKDEIKQNAPFPNLETEIYLNLQRTAFILASQMNVVFLRKHLTQQQYNILRILRGTGENGITGKEIGERLINKGADPSPDLERLEIMNLIKRTRSRFDQKVINITITNPGLDLLTELDKPVNEGLGRAFEHLNSDEMVLFNEFLVKARTREFNSASDYWKIIKENKK